eukprot:403345101
MSKFSEVVRDKLEGHSETVNSIDIKKPVQQSEFHQEDSSNYLAQPQFQDYGLLLSASADKSMAIWDLRLNKRIMMISDSVNIDDEIVKAKFIGDHSVICAWSNQVAIFDVRKPSILMRESKLIQQGANDEINDIDFNVIEENKIQLATCDDTGQAYLYELNINEDQQYTLEPKQTLQNKHSNICFKTMFSKQSPTLLYTAAFDYKLVQWNLKDLKKSCSKNIVDIVTKNFGEQSLHYNPPFIYCMDTYTYKDSEYLVVGLGNGCLLRFKKKDLQLEEIDADLHGDQISSLIINQTDQIVITGSNDKTIALHRMKDDRLIEQTLFRFEVEEKINEIAIRNSFREIYVADLSKTISKFTIRE